MKTKKPKARSGSVKAQMPDALAKLRGDVNRLVERMQTPEHRAAGDALFAATGTELGALAATHARKGTRRKTQTK